MDHADHEVLIAGGGPTGLMLAAELALGGVDVVIVERRTGQELVGSRAGGLNARTLEVLDQRGIVDRFLSQGQTGQHAGFAWIRLDISDLPTRHNYVLALWQNQIERILAEWVAELKVPTLRGREVSGFTQNERGVDVALSDGTMLRARYLVGCDGGRSVVRRAAGIDFAGWDATLSHILAEAELAEEPQWGLWRDASGIRSFGKLADGKTVRLMVTEPHPGRGGEPTLGELREALVAAWGTDYGIHDPTSISRFSDMARQAAQYRQRRVLLAGDAAHVHYPAGGQGLGTGVQDAVNLGWKLAQVVKGTSPETLLDTYHAERHPVAARILQNTLAQVALLRADDRTNALRETVAELLALDEPRRRIAAMMVGLDIHYDLGAGHPLLGRRMPDLEIETKAGLRRVYSLLHDAKTVVLNFGAPDIADMAKLEDRVRRVDARYDGKWELPVIGEVDAPRAVLVRPDGYVGWVANESRSGWKEAIAKWC